MNAPSDAQLAIRIQQNDTRAAAEFYNRHKGSVYHYCLQLLQGVESAKDAAQNTFLKFFDAINELRQPAAVRAWLYTIARNEVYSSLRQRRNNGPIAEVIDEDTPYEKVVQEEEAEMVQSLLGKLKPEHREVLFLLEYEGMSYAEISRVTGISLSAVESRIFRARMELSEKLQRYLK